jgi:UDP-2,4-diacetamido-2,4,6-trideoxy-beta-L-altropyranose hydrolase
MILAIRADGGPSIGFGHLVRSGALAQTALEYGDRVVYLTQTPEEVRSVCPAGIEIAEVPEEKEIENVTQWICSNNPDVVLTDTYDADTEYQREIRSVAETSVIVLDDTRYTVCADYLVNGNVYAPELSYDWIEPEPAWCLGTDYLLIRNAIRRVAADPPPFRENPQRAVVTMGGSDIRDSTPAVCRAFDGLNVSVDVVIGPGFENHDRIYQSVEKTDTNFRILETPNDFPEHIANADIAVSAAGSTTYELLAVGTPAIVIPQANNQEPIARALVGRDVVESIKPSAMNLLPERIEALLSDVDRRQSLRERGRELVDCRGAERIYCSVCQSEV